MFILVMFCLESSYLNCAAHKHVDCSYDVAGMFFKTEVFSPILRVQNYDVWVVR